MTTFLTNKYTRWYFSLIANARANPVLDRVEKHHILPRSLGGKSDEQNLVKLSPRQHFICHLLLPRMTEGMSRSKMRYALLLMTLPSKKLGRDYKINSHVYHFLKSIKAKRGPMSEDQKMKISESVRKLNYKHTTEIKKLIGNANKGRMTLEVAQKISDSKTGIATRGRGWSTPAFTREKQMLSNLGKKRSLETRQKQSLNKLGRKWIHFSSAETKLASPKEVEDLLQQGWTLGRINRPWN